MFYLCDFFIIGVLSTVQCKTALQIIYGFIVLSLSAIVFQVKIYGKMLYFYSKYRSYFIGAGTKKIFALRPDSFGLRPVSRDFLA